MEKETIVLIIYDIVENKTRNKMVKCLEQYGIRVQKSAFEAELTAKQIRKLMQEAQSIIDEGTDSLRIYLMDDILDIHAWGIAPEAPQDCVII